MTNAPMQSANNYFQQQLGVPLDTIMAPIDTERPAGRSLSGYGVYNAIRAARRSDDASLPMGVWEHELKHADWGKVADIASAALVRDSKDLQLAAWLFESQINRTGFAGIAPCLLLMQGLLETYWEGLYPPLDGGDNEHRANIIRWATNKLLPALRQVRLTACGGAQEYNWADWECAHRNDQLRTLNTSGEAQQIDGPSIDEISAAMRATPTGIYAELSGALLEACAGIEAFKTTLDKYFGQDGPSSKPMADLLAAILSLLEAELNRRGVNLNPQAPAAANDAPAAPPDPAEEPAASAAVAAERGFALNDRADAYAQLAAIADFLQSLEPHSPTPYLLRRAIQWGRLNTAELYQELFITMGGQINVFELLGIQSPAEPDK